MIINGGIAIVNSLRLLILYIYGYKVSIRLHRIMTMNIIFSSLNKFINKNPIGKLINRFSGDMEKIDKDLNFAISTFSVILVRFIYFSILLFIFANFYLLILVLIVIALGLYFRDKYAITNVRLPNLNRTTKSPYYS